MISNIGYDINKPIGSLCEILLNLRCIHEIKIYKKNQRVKNIYFCNSTQ